MVMRQNLLRTLVEDHGGHYSNLAGIVSKLSKLSGKLFPDVHGCHLQMKQRMYQFKVLSCFD